MNQLDTMDQHDTDQKMDAPDYEEDIAEKGPIEANVAALSGEGLVKSRLDQMSILQSAWVYKRAFFFCFMVYTSSIMEYFMITMSGSIIANRGFIEQFGNLQPDGTKVLNTSWVSAWSAIINIGQLVSVTYVPALTDRYGRKIGFYSCWCFFVACLICLTTATTPGVWLLGKLFVGIGIGTAQIISTPYVMEIQGNKVRGGTVALGAMWGTIGGILCSLMLQLTDVHQPLMYKLPIYVVWGPTIAMLFCFIVIPESPWFHARKNDKEKCMKTLHYLYSGIEGFDYEEEYGIIIRNLEHEKQTQGEARAIGWSDVFKGLNLRRLTVMIVMSCSSQLAGLTLVYTYSTYFFELAGFADPFLASLIQSCIGLAAVIVYAVTIDKYGRRWPICMTYTGISVILWTIGGVYYAGGIAKQTALVALVCLWQPCFVVFANSYFLIASELPTAQLRIKTNAASWVTQAILGVVTCFAVPPLLTALNTRAAFVFGATSLPCAIFFWYYLPETKGRSVAEIDELYERHIPAWRWAETETEAERQMRAAVKAKADVGTVQLNGE